MIKIKNIVDEVLKKILVFLLSVMVINVLWQVYTRFILDNPSTFTEELARYLLIWLGLLGSSYVVGIKKHLAIDFVINKVSKTKRKFIEIFIYVALLLFGFFVMVVGGGKLVLLSLYLKQTSAALEINLGYVYLVLPLSGLLIIFYSIINIIVAIKNNKLK